MRKTFAVLAAVTTISATAVSARYWRTTIGNEKARSVAPGFLPNGALEIPG